METQQGDWEEEPDVTIWGKALQAEGAARAESSGRKIFLGIF